MKRFLGLLAIITLAAGCGSQGKNDTVSTVNMAVSVRSNPANTDITPDNKTNPYDSIGYWHNRVLEAVHDFILEKRDTTSSGIQAFIADYFRENRQQEVLKDLKIIPENLPKTIINDYKKVVFGQPLAPVTVAFLQQIFETIRQCGNTSYRTFKANIVKIEHRILGNNKLSKRDFAMLLSTTSLARYSGFYWEKILDSHGNKPLAAKGGGFIRFLKRAVAFFCTCTADASGAAYAYLRGRPDQIIADASYLSTITWGGLTYYNNW